MAKFMLSLRDENFQLLISEAQERGITIQELIRAVIIPDWVKQASVDRTSSNTSARSISGSGNGRDTIVQPITRVRRLGNTNYPTQL